MRRIRMLLAVSLVFGVVFAPAAASAQECATLEGSGFLDFGTTGQGILEVELGGEAQTVPFFPTGVREIGENRLLIRFVMFFEQGPLVVVEDSLGTPLGDDLVFFESTLKVKKGGAGQFAWYGIADVAAGVADIQNISGELCFGR